MFYRAVVEDNNDPQHFGRVQVRVLGMHDSGSGVTVGDLPWAEVAGGTDFGLVDGVGISSVLRKGTMVWVFFNNDDFNFPVVMGTIKGSSDVSSEAKGSYGNTATIKTASGHIIELGDAGGAEKIEIKHSSGSKLTFQADGSIIIESVNGITQKATADSSEQVGGTKKITASNLFLN